MRAKKRIALYGGTFDPVHLGHLEVARSVATFFEIEQIFFIPAQVAPHKIGRPVTPPVHRFAMLALATQHDANLLISSFELDAPDRRYTVETMAHFQRTLGEANEIFFIMGADSWSEITTWREWERLLLTANHIVVTRPGYDAQQESIGEEVQKHIIDLRPTATVSKAAVPSGSEPKIFITDLVMKDISATEIRHAASEGRFADLATMVPQPVADYIEKYGIYRDANETRLNC